MDGIVSDSTGKMFNKATAEITALRSHVHIMAPNATINVLNILPRNSYQRNIAINYLKHFIDNLLCQYSEIKYIDTELNRCLFSAVDGYRINYYFKPSISDIPDNAHLNNK